MAPPREESTISVQFDHLSEARQVIEALEEQGVDGSAMRLHGPGVPDEGPNRRDMAAQDRRTAGREAKASLRGAMVGGIAGLVLGTVLGLILSTITMDETGFGVVLAFAIGGLAAGALVGVPIGAYRGVKQSPAWEETFRDEQPGPAILDITVDGDEQLETVRGALAAVQGGAGDGETAPR